MMTLQDRAPADRCPLQTEWFDQTCATFEDDVDLEKFEQAQLGPPDTRPRQVRRAIRVAISRR